MQKLILLAFLFCFSIGISQTDTIYIKKTGLVPCKIIKKTKKDLFYSVNGTEKSIALSDVMIISEEAEKVKEKTEKAKEEKPKEKTDKPKEEKSNEKTEPAKTEKPKTEESKPLRDKNCNVSSKKEKGEIISTIAFANWARFTRIIKAQDTSYYADFWSEGLTEDRYNHGVSFLFSDKTKYVCPDNDINCKLGPDGFYDYTVHYKLKKSDIEILSQKIIISFKLYNAERGIGETQGRKVMESLVCLIKS